MNNKPPAFNLSEFVKLTCWISIVCILWMWTLKIVPVNVATVSAFVFFLITVVLVIADGRRKH